MEPKQIGMLVLLLAVALIGSAYIVVTLQRLDKQDDGDGNAHDNHHGEDDNHPAHH